MSVENPTSVNSEKNNLTKIETVRLRIKDYSERILSYGMTTGRVSLVVTGLGLLSLFATYETKELLRLVLKNFKRKV